jgi:hypothetical protein
MKALWEIGVDKDKYRLHALGTTNKNLHFPSIDKIVSFKDFQHVSSPTAPGA